MASLNRTHAPPPGNGGRRPLNAPIKYATRGILPKAHRDFGVRRPLNAPKKYAALFFRSIAPGERYCRVAAMLTLRLYFRRHFKAATSVPPLDHVRVAPAGEYALRAEFFKAHRDFGVRRPLNAPEAREPRRGDSRPLPRPTFGRRWITSGYDPERGARFARIFFYNFFNQRYWRTWGIMR
ncbi:MAG: hypothetical protein IJZ19_06315 [Lentisphaeria bacterium]|nr:hypothetical protein [Lentisphaeria bacterium]